MKPVFYFILFVSLCTPMDEYHARYVSVANDPSKLKTRMVGTMHKSAYFVTSWMRSGKLGTKSFEVRKKRNDK